MQDPAVNLMFAGALLAAPPGYFVFADLKN